MQLVLDTYGLSLKSQQGVFVVSDGEKKHRISTARVESVAVISPCLISSAAMELAAKEGVPIFVFDQKGDVVAALRSPYFESLATLRRKQVYFSDQLPGAQWVVDQFRLKTEFQIKLLQKIIKKRSSEISKLNKEIQDLQDHLGMIMDADQPPSPEWASKLMGWEGAMAKKYWHTLSKILPVPWQFTRRSRRPARDAFNATINYMYAFLYSIVEQALFGAGLDPHLGVLHADEYDRPTLAYDLIEPFRPWVDELVINHILQGVVAIEWYDVTADGVFLNRPAKRYWISALNEWMAIPIRWQSRQMARKAHIFRKADELAKHIRESTKRPI